MAKPSSARRGRSGRDERRRTLSQNFLRDARAIEKLVTAAELDPGALVVEIGAGDGALTDRLAAAAGSVVAYEVDPHYARVLERRFAGRADVQVLHQDIFDAHPPATAFDVVANTPFSITSRVVSWCLDAPALAAATLITQLEYAKKRTGEYGRWSRLTISTWPWHEWQFRGRIPKQAFRPVPRVDGGIVRLVRRPSPLVEPGRRKGYVDAVALGFQGVGGSLRASLSRAFPARRVDAALRAAGVARDAVVAFVTPQQWLEVYARLDGPR